MFGGIYIRKDIWACFQGAYIRGTYIWDFTVCSLVVIGLHKLFSGVLYKRKSYTDEANKQMKNELGMFYP